MFITGVSNENLEIAAIAALALVAVALATTSVYAYMGGSIMEEWVAEA